MRGEMNIDGASLFAAANGGRGFVGFYEDIFGRKEITRRYLIKGGPGTGKSTFMGRVAEAAEGAGFFVERYKCSSDPESLDAIVIDGRVAVIDATAPHSLDATLPGARDEIVDLGQFWRADGLSGCREEIESLGRGKSDCYRAAYRLLSSAMQVEENSRELIARYVRLEKMRRAVKRLTARIPDGEGYALSVGICDSLGMKGRVYLDTYERRAKRLYLVEDAYKLGSMFLGLVAEEAVAKGNGISVSYYPLDPTYPDGVFFEESRVAFVLDRGASEGERIGVKRFLDTSKEGFKKAKGEYKTDQRLCEGLCRSALDRLAEAGEYHFRLERIYGRQMDFVKMGEFTRDFIGSLMAYMKKNR